MAEDSSGSPRTPALARRSSLFHLVQPLLGVCDPPQFGGKREALVVPVVCFIPRLCAALILAPQLGVFAALHLRTCPSGRFFLHAARRFSLTIPGIRVYNSIRRSLRPSGDPVLNGNPSFCVAGGFVLYVYVVSVLINNFVQIELVCSLISVYYSGYINGCVSQSYRSSNHVAVVPSSFPIQIRLDDVAFFDYFLYRCNAQHL